MNLPQIDAFHLVVAGFVLLVMLIFSPTRAVLAWLFKLLMEGLTKLAGIVFTIIHEGGTKLFEAHVVWFKNWMPRQFVIPSLRNGNSTRRNP